MESSKSKLTIREHWFCMAMNASYFGFPMLRNAGSWQMFPHRSPVFLRFQRRRGIICSPSTCPPIRLCFRVRLCALHRQIGQGRICSSWRRICANRAAGDGAPSSSSSSFPQLVRFSLYFFRFALSFHSVLLSVITLSILSSVRTCHSGFFLSLPVMWLKATRHINHRYAL